jgi:hypothetical protein
MKKIYIAGKVTGLLPAHVQSKFFDATLAVNVAGFDAVNPIEVVNDPTTEWDTAMKLCVAALLKCDAVIALPCFEDSRGAKVELWLSMNLAIPIFYNIEQLKQWNNSQPTV